MSSPSPAADRDVVLPWLVLGAFWGIVALFAALWAAASLAAAVGGGTVAPFGASFVFTVLRGDTATAWPGVSPVWLGLCGTVMAAVTVVLAVVLVVAVRRGLRGRRRGEHWRLALPSLADEKDLAALTVAGTAARAGQLRPSLAGVDPRRLHPDDYSVPLADLLPSGEELRGTLEDVGVAFMAPRSGKTTALAIPMALAAPGCLVATGNKADLWAATAALRAEAGSRVWTFDPQSIAYAPQQWWWNPLEAVRTVEEADRLASHFVQEIRSSEKSGGDFWMQAAGDLLASLLLAAACAGRTLLDVYAWLNDSASPLPAELLTDHGFPALAKGLRGRQAGAPETREGIFETARAAAKCLRNDGILRWVTPGQVHRKLDVAAFAASYDSLYLMSKYDEGAAAPLVAALTDQVVRAAVRRAEAHGGRIDPPVMLVLDEAANICKIGDLPALYSHLGSRGIIPLTILQSYQQGVGVWGQSGMDALWSAATLKIIGSGIDDPKMAEDLSRLVGEHDVDTVSYSHSRSGSSTSVQTRRQRILDAAHIRALPKGTGLLMATGARVAAIRFRPWYTGPDQTVIGEAAEEATIALTARARAAGALYPAEGPFGSGTALDDDEESL